MRGGERVRAGDYRRHCSGLRGLNIKGVSATP